MSSAKKASELIKALVDGMDVDHGGEYYSLFTGWERTVGTDIAAHSRVKEIEKGVIIIAVDHPGWAQMIQLQKKKILFSCRKQYPELNIKEMRVILDSENNTRLVEKKVTEKKPFASRSKESKPEKKGVQPREFSKLLKRLESAIQEQEDSSH